MTKVCDILSYIDSLAPNSMKMDWDNTGLLCGHSESCVQRILVALDPFEQVCREAVEKKADLLVTHHPLIFGQGLTAVNDGNETGRALLMLAENKIAAINAHTNLDCAAGGVNDVLADVLGLKDVAAIAFSGKDFGLLRHGYVSEQSLENFLAHVKSSLSCDGLRYVDGKKPVRHVAVGGGSCGDCIIDAFQAGCDTFVTSDIKYNQFHSACALGMNLIDAGHFHTEAPVIHVLAQKLQLAFPNVEVMVSENLHDAMKFFA